MNWFSRTKPVARLADLFAGLRRGHGGTPLGTYQRFPTAEELLAVPELRFDPLNPNGAIPLGLVGAQISEEADGSGRVLRHAVGGSFIGVRDDRHLLTVAGTRCGKGRALLTNAMITYPGSVYVSDPKGDLATLLAAYRARVLKQKVFVWDPFCVCGPEAAAFRVSYNPMQHANLDDADALIELAALIADSLIVRQPGSKDPHWDEAALRFCLAVVLHVLTWPTYRERRNLGTVYDLIMHKAGNVGSKDDELSELAEEMLDNHAADDAVIAGAREQFEREDREASGVLSSLRRHLAFLGFPRIRRALEDGPFDPAMMQKETVTFFCTMPALKMGTCAGVMRLCVNMSLAAFETSTVRRDYQFQSGRLPVLMVLDEFATLGHMSRLEDAAGQIAGLGCKLWPIVQDLNQLKALYGARWETWIGNAGAVTFFGNFDGFTLEYIERRLGKTLIYTPSHSTPTFDASISGGATGASFGIGEHPLMSVPELSAVFGRDDPQLRMLVLLPTIGPVILHRAFYDKHPVMKKLLEGR